MSAGVPLTVHSGEQGRLPHFHDAPPGLIVEAVDCLGALRIGHGTSLAASAAVRQVVRERGVADAEVPDLRLHAGDDVQRKFALVGLADPALARELLQQPRPLAVGVVPCQREPGVEAGQNHRGGEAER